MKHFIIVLFVMLFISVNGFLYAGDCGSAGDCAKGDTAYKKLDNKTALEFYQKAIQLNPTSINHHLELAKTYDKMGEKTLAVQEYREVLELPIKDADDEGHKKEAEERLKKSE